MSGVEQNWYRGIVVTFRVWENNDQIYPKASVNVSRQYSEWAIRNKGNSITDYGCCSMPDRVRGKGVPSEQDSQMLEGVWQHEWVNLEKRRQAG